MAQEYCRPVAPFRLIPVVAEPPLFSSLMLAVATPKNVSKYCTLMSLDCSKRMASKVMASLGPQVDAQSKWQTLSNWTTTMRLGAVPNVS